MYGRAKRLNFLKWIVIVLVAVLGVFYLGKTVVSLLIKEDDNVEYRYMRDYLVGKGFSCQSLKSSGDSCKIKTDDVYELFIRFDNGFDYIYNNKSYVIELYHVGGKEKFQFSTGDTAFSGYKNLKYTCSYKESIVGELDKCVLETDDTINLDNEAYIGIINKTMFEVRKILYSSKYDVDDLLNNYKWTKK